MKLEELKVGDIVEWKATSYCNFNLFHPDDEGVVFETRIGGIIKAFTTKEYPYETLDPNKSNSFGVIIWHTFPLLWTDKTHRFSHLRNTGTAQTTVKFSDVLRKLDTILCSKCGELVK